MAVIYAFRERRAQFPRINLEQPVALVHTNATVATAIISNISPGGMQVCCDRYTADSLHASSEPLGKRKAVCIDAHFLLPSPTGTRKIDVECRLAHVAEISEREYALGLEFIEFQHGGREELEAFLAEAITLNQGIE